MEQSFQKIIDGYRIFKKKYAEGDNSIMQKLADHGQEPEIMVVSCCDSRVDPALIMQCDPGELFVARNVANIVPPYETDMAHHGTSSALEYGVCYLNVKHLIILGHSECGGIQGLLNKKALTQNDFISDWVSHLGDHVSHQQHHNEAAKEALKCSYTNALSFPWIKERVEQNKLAIHLWFFDIKEGEILTYSFENDEYQTLESAVAQN